MTTLIKAHVFLQMIHEIAPEGGRASTILVILCSVHETSYACILRRHTYQHERGGHTRWRCIKKIQKRMLTQVLKGCQFIFWAPLGTSNCHCKRQTHFTVPSATDNDIFAEILFKRFTYVICNREVVTTYETEFIPSFIWSFHSLVHIIKYYN